MNERHVGTLSALDLNLLVYLQALLEERSVTRAGERLAISQPAMSQALRRLRRHFDDELLVRNGRCYELSALAQSLQDEVMLTCRLAARIFAAQATFDPAVADREFTLLATDQSVAVLGPSLSSALTGVGPGVRVQLRHIGVGDVARLDDVMRGADGFIAPHSIMSGYPCVELYRDGWVTVADPANSVLGRRPELTMPDLGLLRWVVAYHNPPRDTALIVRELNSHNLDPTVDIVLDSFQSIPFFVTGTDRIACLPAKLADGLWWHPTRDQDAGHIWMRTLMQGLDLAGIPG